jgi:nucleotide-binding universal stress UspA family protein
MTTILVGVDRSAESVVALRWATREAQLRDASVEVVLAWGYLDQYRGRDRFEPFYDGGAARRALREFVTGELPESDLARVELRAVDGFAVDELVSASARADLLVLGPRGTGGFLGLRLGSVTHQCLQDALCPVAVVHGAGVRVRAAGEPETVAVGIDGTEASRAALAWAVDEAARRGARLAGVHAWLDPAVRLPTTTAAVGAGVFEAAAWRCVERELASVDVSGLVEPPTPTVVLGSPGAALLDVAEGADLVVVGSRGLHHVRRFLLGSVAAEVVRHASSPVVVVRPT